MPRVAAGRRPAPVLCAGHAFSAGCSSEPWSSGAPWRESRERDPGAFGATASARGCRRTTAREAAAAVVAAVVVVVVVVVVAEAVGEAAEVGPEAEEVAAGAAGLARRSA